VRCRGAVQSAVQRCGAKVRARIMREFFGGGFFQEALPCED
jgi:hypothetical protein